MDERFDLAPQSKEDDQLGNLSPVLQCPNLISYEESRFPSHYIRVIRRAIKLLAACQERGGNGEAALSMYYTVGAFACGCK
jgi:hypothetical protein